MVEHDRARGAVSTIGVQLDHVVVVVTSLADATATFTAAGFTVTPGGRHDDVPTENALIGFGDGSYLELLAAREPGTRRELRALKASGGWERHLKGVSAIARRFLPALAGADGVADWVLCDDLAATAGALGRRAATLRALGVKASGPVAMARERPDGVRLEWQLLLPESRFHPFWIADRTPRERRVPGEAGMTTHANGARGIATVRVRTPGAALAALELGETLGVVPRAGAQGSVLELAGFQVEVDEGEAAGAFGVRLAGCAQLPAAIVSLGVERLRPLR
jgi:hypothetical protein